MHTTETITAMLSSRDDAVKRAIVRLSEVGFEDGPDAVFLADIARKLPLYNGSMTGPQLRRARRALNGYTERLRDIANARNSEAEKPAPPAIVMREPEPVKLDYESLWGLY